MTVVDTSVLYALFDDADAHHARARADLGSRRRWAVPFAVLVEFLLVVHRRKGREAAQRALDDLDSLGTMDVLQPQDVGKALAIWRGNPALSAADAVGIQESLQSGVPLLTYDEDQAKAYRALAN